MEGRDVSALPEDTRPLRRLDRATALDRVVAFAQRFGLDHLRLAEHAAFPMLLTPDLLYRLWAAFTPEAPWTAVSDLLLSNLCREVDHELFEMEPTTRAVLLDMLQDDESLGPPRVGELAGFLLDYVEQQLGGDETGLRELSEAHRWMALAYARPGDTAQSLAALLSQIFNKLTDGPAGFTGDDWSELLRVSSLVESLAVPLSDYRPLLSFARAMDRSAWGDTGAATRHLSLVLKAKKDEAAGIDLSLSFLRSIGGREFSERRVARALESVLRTARARSGTARQGEGPTPASSRARREASAPTSRFASGAISRSKTSSRLCSVPIRSRRQSWGGRAWARRPFRSPPCMTQRLQSATWIGVISCGVKWPRLARRLCRRSRRRSGSR